MGNVYIRYKMVINAIIILFIAITLIFGIQLDSFAQAAKLIDTDEKKEEAKGPSAFNAFISRVDTDTIRYGLLPGLSMPMGDVGTVLNMGFGADLFADIDVPFSMYENVYLKAGVNLGFYSLSSNINASLMMIPFLIGAKAIYPLPYGFSPYVGLSGGATMNMATGDVNASGLAGTFAFNLGTSYNNIALPKDLTLFFDIEYLMAFETVTGQFLTFSLGASYSFGGTTSQAKVGGSSDDDYSTQESVLMH